MTTYKPPNENLPIFDPLQFQTADINLTQAIADTRYLRFPNAQGTENLGAINVNGASIFNSTVAFNDATLPTSIGVLPASNDSTTKIPTTAWVQTAITAGAPNLLISNNTWTGTQNWSNASVGSLTSSAVQPASNDSTTKIPTTAWVQSAISGAPPVVSTLSNVLLAGNSAGASDINMNNNDINSIGILNVSGGINQINSNYINTTVSTGDITQISGGSVINTTGTNTGTLNAFLLTMNDSSAGINKLEISNSSIIYEEDSGGADQLIIASNTTDNPILIQSNGTTTPNGGGIFLNTTTAGASIILETTSSTSPVIPSNIQLITNGSSGAELGVQSSISLDTDNVYVRNGSMRIQNDRNNFGTGLSINDAVVSGDFQIVNNAGTLTLGTTINNITMNTSQTVVQSNLLIEQITYPPSAFTALGYSVSYSPYVLGVNPYIATTSADQVALLGLVNINYKGVYLMTLQTLYSSPTTASVHNQSCYLSTDNLTNTKTLGVELNNANVSVSTTGLQNTTIASAVVDCPNNFNSFYVWVRCNTSGAFQEIGITIKYTKIG